MLARDLTTPRKHAAADLIAGLTFAVVNIPTAMAHAMMAAVNPVLGTYTLIFGTPVGAIFSSSVFMNISTTSAMSVAAGSVLIGYSGESRTQALVVLVVLVGVIQLVLGVLKQGSMIRFVPHSVMVGFANGVAVLIILGQLSDLTGYESVYSNKIAQTLDMLLHFRAVSFQSLAIGVLTILLVLLVEQHPIAESGCHPWPGCRCSGRAGAAVDRHRADPGYCQFSDPAAAPGPP